MTNSGHITPDFATTEITRKIIVLKKKKLHVVLVVLELGMKFN